MFLDLKKLRQFNQQVRVTPSFKDILMESADYFEQNLLYEDPDSIEELAGKINKREIKNSLRESQAEAAANHHWVFGEKKIFCWALIFYAHFENIALEELHRASREPINEIFVRKHPIFIRYEMIRLLNKKMGKKVPWIEQEVALFSEAPHSFSEGTDWKAISFDLFVRSSGEVFRSPNECREKWCNFLNPNLKRESWSLEEDLKLFELVQRFGCRWAMISRQFGECRTQHMVKNRVNLFYNNWKSKKKSSKKRDIFNSIYSYLKKRMSKSQRGSKAAEESLERAQDQGRGQYNCLQYHESNQAEEPIANEPQQFPLHLLQFKEEKRTLDEEELDPSASDQPGMEEASGKLLFTQPIDFFDLFCQDLSKSSRQPQYGVEMRVVEDEVVRALGCHHFQRLPNQQFQQEQAQEEESFCWL